MGTSWIIITSSVLLLSFLTLGSFQFVDDFADLQGPYCREIGCCLSRTDSCSKPIIGTLCYCDEFCNRTNDHDCCPDYWRICKGIDIVTPLPTTTTRRPPEEIKSCTYNDIVYPLNKTIQENCNTCKCEEIAGGAGMRCEQNICLVSPDIIQNVNAGGFRHGWTASNYSKFWGRTLVDGVRYRLGTLQPQKDVMRMNSVKRYYDPAGLPRRFNSSENWQRDITGIQDQGWCGSSWAISTAAVASDRYGIISKGLERVRLSAQNIISCIPRSLGCDGGRLDRAWTFVKKYGIVDETCFPYTGSNFTRCNIRRVGSLKEANCDPPKYTERTGRYKVAPAYRLGNETDIMYEILLSGPVQATLKVYHDFFHYSGGIYRHTDLALSHQQGYHSVRIIGWGEDFTDLGLQKYWIVANSWGTDWGENGYFKIARGINECEIETFVLAVWSDVDRRVFNAYGSTG